MLTPHEAALESKCARIARILARNRDVTVRIEGGRAYIDLETMTIVLPNLTGDALEHVERVIDGFLDHECGHAKYTDPLITRQLKEDPVLFEFWNPVEDAWTERVHGEELPGVKQNLHALNEAIGQVNRAKWHKADPVFKLLYAMAECWRGASQPADFEADPQIGLVFQFLGPEVRDGYAICSTQEAVDLAKRIRDKLASMAQAMPQPKTGQKGPSGKGQGQGPQGQAPQPESGAREGKEESEGSAGGGGAKDGEEPESDQAASGGMEGVPEGQGSQEPQEGSEGGSVGSGKEEPKDALQGQAMALQDLIERGAFETPTDAEQLFNDYLTDVPDKRKHGDPEEYIVFSEEFDTETYYHTDQRLAWAGAYHKLKGEVWEYVGNMAAALEAALEAESASRWVGGARRGRKFDRRVFPLWTQGGQDERIYRQKEQGEHWDTAVSLLWDCSGSMQKARPGSPSYLARLAAIAFHEALVRVGITHEVLGFNTSETDSPELGERIRQARLRGEDLSRYSRLEERDKRMVFVPWGSEDGRAICAINGSSSNRDGECVMWAAKRLAARPERRKVLIVGSDGQPAGAVYGYTEEKYLQQAVKQVIEAGIEVYAIGIMNASVKKYYPQWVLIEKIEDLPGAVLRQLAQALFQHKGTDHGNLPEICKPGR